MNRSNKWESNYLSKDQSILAIFINSLKRFSWIWIDIVKRNLMLVTVRAKRAKGLKHRVLQAHLWFWNWKFSLHCFQLIIVPTMPQKQKVTFLKLHANYGCNDSQHSWVNNVGSCCVHVGSGVQAKVTTPNNVGTCSASWAGYNA